MQRYDQGRRLNTQKYYKNLVFYLLFSRPWA